VGKTVVTAWIARRLKGLGTPVAVRKPIATGASRVSADTLELAKAVGKTDAATAITRWTFPDPASPPVAARKFGVSLRLDEIYQAVFDGVADETFVLVEGIGGLLCPVTERETVADLVQVLGLPLVLVTRRLLGTLSLTAMAEEVALKRSLPLIGVVVSETEPCEGLAAETNVEELRTRLKTPLLAVCYHQSGAEPVPQPDLESVDWQRLCLGNP